MPSDAYCHEDAARADAAQHADAWSDADDQPTRAEQTEEAAWLREQTRRQEEVS
jgi:hypothetical protein